MYICIECREIFSDPKEYVNRHVPENYLYNERYTDCPYCGGAYVEAHKCDSCGEYITDKYIKVGDERFCEDCVLHYEIGEE